MTTIRTDGRNVEVLPLVRELAGALRREEIAYCHWKGTYSLQRVVTGEKDVDLLVSRRDYDRFLTILARLGFKEARQTGTPPGVHHYYGYDHERGRLVHVHSQSEIVFGSAVTGTYRLPVEGPYLGAAILDNPFRIPQPEFEFILLVVRMSLWQSPTSVLNPFRKGSNLPLRRRQELADLRSRCDLDVVQKLIREFLPQLDNEVFENCLATLERDSGVLDRVRVWWRLQEAVVPWPYVSRAGHLGLTVSRRVGRMLTQSIGRRSPEKRLVSGGALVAFVGGDGAGKSTAIESISSWLGSELAISRVHLGKPLRSFATWVIRGSLKGFRILRTMFGRRSWNEAKWRATSTSYSALVWHVCRARDRYRLSRRARRMAIRGDIVLCDRFPLMGPVRTDGPRLEGLLGDGSARSGLGMKIKAYLTRLERRYYERVPEPDLLVVLRLDPDIAAARKPEEGAEWVRGRSREVWEADWSQVRAEVVDASLPVDELHTKLRALTWQQL